MKEKITNRFNELINTGSTLIAKVNNTQSQDMLKMLRQGRDTYINWMASVVNLINIACNKNSNYVQNGNKLLQDITGQTLLDDKHVKQVYGLLNSAKSEWDKGLLTEVEYIYAAESFDDFLDHAEEYYKANKVMESSVLASAVLEDTMKKIAIKNSLNPKQTLDPLIDELVKIDIFTKIKAKRVKAYAGVRNSALHVNWSDIRIEDVGEMIKGIRELIDEFLT